jgi:hypothetical protein
MRKWKNIEEHSTTVAQATDAILFRWAFLNMVSLQEVSGAPPFATNIFFQHNTRDKIAVGQEAVSIRSRKKRAVRSQ